MRQQKGLLGQMIRLFGVALVCASFLQACGGAGASPPVSIPAPVAGLISVTSPDAGGMVRMRGDAASAESGATLQISLVSSGGSTLLAQSVLAQTIITTTVATSSGSFVVDFGAAVGDLLQVDQVIDGEVTADPVLLEVLPGRILLGGAPLGATFTQAFSEGCTSVVVGSDTTLACFSPSTLQPLLPDAVITGVQANDLAFDNFTSDTYLTDAVNDIAVVIDPFGSIKGASLALTEPLAVAADTALQFSCVVQGDGLNSMTLVDNTAFAPALDATLLVTHPTDGGASHVRSFAVATQKNALIEPKFAVLSEFDNGDTIFSLIGAVQPPGGSLVIEDQVNLGSGQFDSVALINSATEALVTNRTTGSLIKLSGAGFTTQVSILVGEDARGVAFVESLDYALVALPANHQLAVVDLIADQLIGIATTQHGVGLGPIDVAVNDSPFVALVANQTDESASLFDIDELLLSLGL